MSNASNISDFYDQSYDNIDDAISSKAEVLKYTMLRFFKKNGIYPNVNIYVGFPKRTEEAKRRLGAKYSIQRSWRSVAKSSKNETETKTPLEADLKELHEEVEENQRKDNLYGKEPIPVSIIEKTLIRGSIVNKPGVLSVIMSQQVDIPYELIETKIAEGVKELKENITSLTEALNDSHERNLELKAELSCIKMTEDKSLLLEEVNSQIDNNKILREENTKLKIEKTKQEYSYMTLLTKLNKRIEELEEINRSKRLDSNDLIGSIKVGEIMMALVEFKHSLNLVREGSAQKFKERCPKMFDVLNKL
jgi:hypothetical protein